MISSSEQEQWEVYPSTWMSAEDSEWMWQENEKQLDL